MKLHIEKLLIIIFCQLIFSCPVVADQESIKLSDIKFNVTDKDRVEITTYSTNSYDSDFKYVKNDNNEYLFFLPNTINLLEKDPSIEGAEELISDVDIKTVLFLDGDGGYTKVRLALKKGDIKFVFKNVVSEPLMAESSEKSGIETVNRLIVKENSAVAENLKPESIQEADEGQKNTAGLNNSSAVLSDNLEASPEITTVSEEQIPGGESAEVAPDEPAEQENIAEPEQPESVTGQSLAKETEKIENNREEVIENSEETVGKEQQPVQEVVSSAGINDNQTVEKLKKPDIIAENPEKTESREKITEEYKASVPEEPVEPKLDNLETAIVNKNKEAKARKTESNADTLDKKPLVTANGENKEISNVLKNKKQTKSTENIFLLPVLAILLTGGSLLALAKIFSIFPKNMSIWGLNKKNVILPAQDKNSFVMVVGADSEYAVGIAEEYAANGYNLYLAGKNTEIINQNFGSLPGDNEINVKVLSFHPSEFYKHRAFYNELEQKPYGVVFINQPINCRLNNNFVEIKKVIDSNFTNRISILNIIANDFENRGYGFITIFDQAAQNRNCYLAGSVQKAFNIFIEGLKERLAVKNIELSVTNQVFRKKTGLTVKKPSEPDKNETDSIKEESLIQ